MKSISFKIHGMDCAEEVAVLKRELAPLVGGEERLAFDLINGRLTILDAPPPVDARAIHDAVGRTGMKAVDWDKHLAATRAGRSTSFWEQHGRTIACSVSGASLALGYLVHAVVHGPFAALRGEAHPPAAIALYLLAIVTGVWYVAPKAVYAAKRLRPDMNLLMTVAIIGAVGIGEWFEAATVAFLFALALLLESWSVGRARKAISALMDLTPARARVRCPHDGCIEEKPVEDVAVGATVLVKPAEKIPLDGVVSSGTTSVNEAPITGESMPASKGPGDRVFAGTINHEGAFEFTVTRAAGDTTLARIIHMVETAQSRRAPSEQWVEKFARYYTPVMMGLAVTTALLPPLVLGASWAAAFYQGLVILVIACPCALVISTPVSIVAGLAAAARAGVLIKGGVHLETPASVRAIAFDKTGTVTSGRPEVQHVVPLNGHTAEELLERAAALEAHSEHPLAAAILRKARESGVPVHEPEQFQIIPGKGAEGTLYGKAYWVGSHRFLHEMGLESEECHAWAESLEDAGHSVVAIGNREHVCGLLSVADAVRPEAAALIRELRDEGVERVIMLTGDNERTARAVAAETGIDEVRAELLPEEKVDAVAELVARYGKVAMVGDGVNDAPAMAAASVGIVMGAAGSDAAIESADVALMADDLARIPWLLRHSRRTLRTIQQNIAFALGLKFLFVVLAFAGVATLWMAIAADMGASLLVIFNGLRLLRG